MIKKRVIVWSIIALLTIVAVLEVFDFHPRLDVGRYGFVSLVFVRWDITDGVIKLYKAEVN
jgi:hypothetical protein